MRTFHGQKARRNFNVKIIESEATASTCKTCGGPTRRNKYRILHKDCSVCRYLKMIYGPSIPVERWQK
jgi:tRNA G26 N,N-dimethylase Trm1